MKKLFIVLLMLASINLFAQVSKTTEKIRTENFKFEFCKKINFEDTTSYISYNSKTYRTVRTARGTFNHVPKNNYFYFDKKEDLKTFTSDLLLLTNDSSNKNVSLEKSDFRCYRMKSFKGKIYLFPSNDDEFVEISKKSAFKLANELNEVSHFLKDEKL